MNTNQINIGKLNESFTKTFRIDRHGLIFLAKLQAYGLHDSAVNLLKDYLSNRRQRVKIGDYHSTWKEILKGVPQGSVRGLYFSIYLSMTSS